MARGPGLRKSLAEKFDDELKFFKGWIDKPKAVGSIVPTSSITARKMASIVNPNPACRCSKSAPAPALSPAPSWRSACKPENLYAVEYSTDFVRHLRQLYPGVNVIEGDAFNLDTTLGDKRDMVFDSVVSGVPLLNFPVAQRIAYIESLLDRIPAGRPIVQLTYGPLSPIPPGRGDYTVKHFDFVIRNIPPTQLWIYRRAAH